MLQTTEFSRPDFRAWLKRARNFREVQTRRELIFTRKIKLLFLAEIFIIILILALAIFLIFLALNFREFLPNFAKILNSNLLISKQIFLIILALILLIFTPIFLPHLLLIPLILGDFLIQKPLAKKQIRVAREKLAKHPALKIAIAGSFGKTTAKHVLAQILSAKFKVATPDGNINQPLGFAKFISELSGDEEILIFEFGEYLPGDIAKMCDFIAPEIGFITGINDAHLQNFKTRKNLINDILDLRKYLQNREKNAVVIASKTRQFSKGKSQNSNAKIRENLSPEKYIYLNYDSEILRENILGNHEKSPQDLARKTRKNFRDREIFYSKSGLISPVKSPVKIKNLSAFGTEFSFANLQIFSKLLGEQNIGIICAAVDFAKKLNLSDEQILHEISQIEPFEHRLQPRFLSGAILIDDTYNGNLDGFRAGIKFLSELESDKNFSIKRKIYITPGLVEQGSAKLANHQTIAELLAAAKFDKIILVQNSATKIIRESLATRNYVGEILEIENPREFYENLASFLAAGDVVLMQNDWTDNYA